MKSRYKKTRRLLLILLALASFIGIAGHVVSALHNEEPAKVHRAFLFGENGYIRPNDPLTRAEAAMAFYQLLDDERREAFSTNHNDYTDVSPYDWFNTAVSTISNAGLITGFYAEAEYDEYYEYGEYYKKLQFLPDEPITRAEFAVIAVRFAGVYVYPSENRFRDTYEHYDDYIINTALDNGWITCAGGAFLPNAVVTRTHAAIMLSRKFDRVPECIDSLLPDMLTWYDYQRTWGRIESDRPRLIFDPGLTFSHELVQRLTTDTIILHHLNGLNTVGNVHRDHLNRGWKGIGYNFQVNRNGTIWRGRGMDYIGAHTLNNNARSIGIALQGRFNDHDRSMSNAQFDSLMWLIRHIHSIYGELPVVGHRDVGQSSCPGRFFPMAEVQRLQFRDQSNVIGYRYDWITPRYWLYIQAASNTYTLD